MRYRGALVMAAAVVGIAVMAVWFFHGERQVDSLQSDDLSESIPADGEPASGNEGRSFDDSGQERTGKRASATASDNRSSARSTWAQPISIAEYATAADALASIRERPGMGERDFRRNIDLWRAACEHVRTPTGLFPPQLLTESSRPALEDFERFCAGIGDFAEAHAREIDVEAVDEIFDQLEDAMFSEPPESWSEKVERLGRERAVEMVFEQLRQALATLNEARVEVLMMRILNEGLFPYTEATGPRSADAAFLLIQPLIHSLLCQRTDGCRETDHPYVVRFCLIQYAARHQYCDAPTGIEDAIYQTLSPVEYDHFLRIRSWMTSKLINHQ